MGTSTAMTLGRTSDKDHPHACGDKMPRGYHSLSHSGSSPRVWGQVRVSSKTAFAIRIIPTRVGTRAQDGLDAVLHRDHPHACGDKLYIFAPVGSAMGSSPRVWGQVTRYLHMLKDSGIIPTRVGTRCCFHKHPPL